MNGSMSEMSKILLGEEHSNLENGVQRYGLNGKSMGGAMNLRFMKNKLENGCQQVDTAEVLGTDLGPDNLSPKNASYRGTFCPLCNDKKSCKKKSNKL